MPNLDGWLSGAEQVLSATRRLRLDENMEAAVATTASALRRRLPFLVCGNGGSAADAQHIVGELIGRFLKERPDYKAICLSSNPAVLTAWSNDYSIVTTPMSMNGAS